MRALLEEQFNCKIVQWGEESDHGQLFSAILDGVWIQAESLALLISGLQDRTRLPVLLMAA
jgi:hypothetical protein